MKAMRFLRILVVFGITICASESLSAEPAPRFPGKTARGFLLPNGWTITPAGRQVVLKDLPLNILPLGDSVRALVATSGYNAHELVLLDLATGKPLDTQTVRQSWFGLALSPAGDRLWWSGGGGAALHVFDLKDARLSRADGGDPTAGTGRGDNKNHFNSGLAVDGKRNVLYSLDIDAGTLAEIDLAGKQPQRTLSIGGRPYDIAIARNGSRLYVSDWAGRAVLAVDPVGLRVVAKIGVGEHPNQIALHPRDDRLFVACASSNQVSVIDTKRGIVTETIFTALFPKAPEGSTPDAVAVSLDGAKLYVANADNNCVAVIDISAPSRSQVQGFIPTGWYPTAVAVTPDGKNLLVGVGKGNQTYANPIPKTPEPPKPGDRGNRGRPYPYIGTTLSGALSIVSIPDDKQLAEYTETVYRNCPYSDKLLTDAPYQRKTAIPPYPPRWAIPRRSST
jgi:YVTN family beta-propeller protein